MAEPARDAVIGQARIVDESSARAGVTVGFICSESVNSSLETLAEGHGEHARKNFGLA
ncbi:hypothetical protein [Nonomuraea sp. GTA35]|uniref:hypothetical protein n=1 Tax=Nonomuraea sp. GTA35 TaxID=1676746 RepID=UPI0035C2030D